MNAGSAWSLPPDLSAAGEPDREPPRPPCAGIAVEDAGDGGAAGRAVPVTGQVVPAEAVPVAFDEQRAAAGAGGAPTVAVVDVAGVDVVQPVGQGDAACSAERLRWCREPVDKLVVGMEGGEVEGN